MKNNIISVLFAVLIISTTNGYCQNTRTEIEIPGKGRIEVTGQESIYGFKYNNLRFYDGKGKLIKTITLKSDTVKTGKVLRVTECVGTKAAANDCYIGVSLFRYDPTLQNLGGSSLESWTEYYNPRGKLLWRKDCSGTDVSEDGNNVVLLIPIWSQRSKEYEYPKFGDPKYRERIIVVDSLGRETFRYEADSIRGYDYSGFNISGDFIFAHGAYHKPFTTFSKIVSIKHKRTHTIPEDTAAKYNYSVDKDYSVIYELKDDIIKGVTPFRRVIPLEEWK
jgi:hypothetical protein